MTDKYTFVDTNRRFISYLEKFEEKKKYVVALDTEANSNRHAYGFQLSLVQINDVSDIILVDALQINNRTLRRFFENRNILKVMYDAPHDIYLLKNANGIDLKSVLDLRPGVELLSFEKKDLHSVIRAELGVKLEKKRKFQTHNWLRRPIDPEALNYAANDVRYLLRLKDIILSKLHKKKQMDSFILENLRIQNKDYSEVPEERYKKVKGFNQLVDSEKKLFQRLYSVRDKYAQLVNMASHNLINNQLLLRMAKHELTPGELRFPKRINREIIPDIVRELDREFKATPEVSLVDERL